MASNVLATQMVNIERDLNNLLADERGRWLISSEHHDASSELSLWHRETQRELIIDRTFIDSTSGTRWVIDYKSSQPIEGEALDQFVLRESEKIQRTTTNVLLTHQPLRRSKDTMMLSKQSGALFPRNGRFYLKLLFRKVLTE